MLLLLFSSGGGGGGGSTSRAYSFGLIIGCIAAAFIGLL